MQRPPGSLLSPTRTSFVGRVRELAAIELLFRNGASLVTVTGLGGIGKTRLSSEYVAQCAGSADRDGTPAPVACDLTEVRDGDGLCDALRHALGIDRGRGRDAVEQIGVALSDRGNVLVFLDNFEQLVADGAPLLGHWLHAAPAARFLVTSRERLRLPQEQVYELEPLGLNAATSASQSSEAVQLLVERIRAVRHDYTPGDDGALLGEIARRLDGLPLALELAAARMSVLGPGAVLSRLDQRFALLSGVTRGVAARQQTLRGAIDWSWALLSPWEQDALAQCSVFRGGFDLEAAEHVLDLRMHPDAPGVLDTVQALRDKSLLTVREALDASGELRLGCYLSIAEYAAERLRASGGEYAAQRRHAAWYADFAARWIGPADVDRPEAQARLGRERDNLVALVDRALEAPAAWRDDAPSVVAGLIGLLGVSRFYGRLSAHLARADALERAGLTAGLPPTLATDLHLARAMLYLRLGNAAAEARAEMAAALSLAQQHNDPHREGHARLVLGTEAVHRGQLDVAESELSAALPLLRVTGDRAQEARALYVLGDLARERGDLDASRTHNEHALALYGRLDSPSATVQVLVALATIYLEQGLHDTAEAYLARAREPLERAASAWWAGAMHATHGILEHDRGRLDRAAGHYDAAIAVAVEWGDVRIEQLYRGYRALLAMECGEERAAWTTLQVVREQIADPRYRALMTAHLAVAELAVVGVEQARATLAKAEALLEVGRDEAFAAVVALSRARIDFAAADAATIEGDTATATTLRMAAHEQIARIERPEPPDACHPRGRPALARRSCDVRLALRLLHSARVDAAATPVMPTAPAPPAVLATRATPAAGATPAEPAALVVHPLAHWFQPPGGERVDCRQRQAIRRLLMRLCEARLRTPGQPVPVDALLAAGWPGVKILHEAARARLRVSISRLRQMGLGTLLVSDDDGYMLEPTVPLDFDDASARRATR